MSEQACMGGFCRLREECLHYHSADREEPAERLCVPGRDGELKPIYLYGVYPREAVEA